MRRVSEKFVSIGDCERSPFALLGLALLFTAACSTDIRISHSPVVARDTDMITFTADVTTAAPPTSMVVEILVNSVVEQTCNSTPCSVTRGPFPNMPDNTVAFEARVTADYNVLGTSRTHVVTDGAYFTGITAADFEWNGRDYVPVRLSAPIDDPNGDLFFKEDFVFHMAKDYDEDLPSFFGDVEDKIYGVLAQQELTEANLSKFNFWAYTREARNARNCGKPHRRADNDMPWADTNAVLHVENFGDCTNIGLDRFSAEGSNTRAFLHEAGHAVFGLGDEYDGDTNYTIVESPEPNIFPTLSACQSEQASKGRSQSACYEFTAEDGGWWGIHLGTTVMSNGNVGEPWATEGTERVELFLSAIP